MSNSTMISTLKGFLIPTSLSDSIPSITELSSLPDNDFSIITLISIVAGYLSMGFWLFAQLPQVIENYKNHSVEGIAPAFLASWIAGDVSNLIGCLLTKALPFQILLSSYYCSIDLILSSQYLYYTKIYPKIKHNKYFNQRLHKLPESQNDNNDDDDQDGPLSMSAEFPQAHIGSATSPPSKPINIGMINDPNGSGGNSSGSTISQFLPSNYSLSNMVTTSFLASFTKVKGMPIVKETAAAINDNSSNPVVSMIAENSQIIGSFFAWICTCFYLSARIPQLIKNYKRQSTDGLSILLFVCALNGNIFYTISILTCNEFVNAANYAERANFFMRELPYILGSAGTVMFDFLALYQWRIYRDKNHHTMGNYQRLGANVSMVLEDLRSDNNRDNDNGGNNQVTESDSYTSNFNILSTGAENYETGTSMHHPHHENNGYGYGFDPKTHYNKNNNSTNMNHFRSENSIIDSENTPSSWHNSSANKNLQNAYSSLKQLLIPISSYNNNTSTEINQEKTKLSADFESLQGSYGSVFLYDRDDTHGSGSNYRYSPTKNSQIYQSNHFGSSNIKENGNGNENENERFNGQGNKSSITEGTAIATGTAAASNGEHYRNNSMLVNTPLTPWDLLELPLHLEKGLKSKDDIAYSETGSGGNIIKESNGSNGHIENFAPQLMNYNIMPFENGSVA